MDQDRIRTEIARLRSEIRRHNDLYYKQAAPEIEDQAYDRLLEDLAALEASHPEAADSDSPLLDVGSDSDGRFPNLPHSHPMISLQNSYDPAEIAAFDQRVRRELDLETLVYTVEPKIDGVAVALRYASGDFALGLTRGDGRSGDVITGNLRTFREIPGTLPDHWRSLLAIEGLEIRGEAYMGLERFTRLNEARQLDGLAPFANPRNATAGTLKTLDASVVRQRGLSLFCYQMLPLDGELALQSHTEELAAIRDLGLPVNPFLRTAESVEAIISALDELAELRGGLDYQIDGAVIKVNDLSLHGELGATAKSPRWGIAYKYAAEEAITRLESVTLQVGRTGVITPVAELAEVQIAGSRVSRATLHNWEEIERKDIREGDMVVVAKGGDIIPKVLRVLAEERSGDEREIPRPDQCPVCGSPASQAEGEVAIRCRNELCPARLAGRLRHFAGRDACDIEGLGTRGIEQLLDAGWVRDLPDLFALDVDQLAALPGWGPLSAEKLIKALSASAARPWANKLFALGIPGVGINTARILARRYPNIKAFREASREDLEALSDIGPETATVIINYNNDNRIGQMVQALLESGFLLETEIVDEPPPPAVDSVFNGQTFVLTGTLETCTRNQAKKWIEAAGGKVSGSVSRKTGALITGADPGSKYAKALDLGVRILTETEFIDSLIEAGLQVD